MRKFNYILNDLAFETLVTKCLYGEPTDEDVKECENQIELLKQENQTLKEVIEEVREVINGYMPNEKAMSKALDEIEFILDKAKGE